MVNLISSPDYWWSCAKNGVRQVALQCLFVCLNFGLEKFLFCFWYGFIEVYTKNDENICQSATHLSRKTGKKRRRCVIIRSNMKKLDKNKQTKIIFMFFITHQKARIIVGRKERGREIRALELKVKTHRSPPCLETLWKIS